MADNASDNLQEQTVLKYKNERKNMVRGTAEVLADPQRDFGALRNFSGIGNFFSGNYYTVSVTHKFSNNGYRQTIEVIKQEWDGKATTGKQQSSSQDNSPRPQRGQVNDSTNQPGVIL